MTPATDIWTGGNQLVDTNWSDPLNWSLGAIPGAADTAVFTSGAEAATSNVDTPLTVAAVLIDSSWGGTVNVNSALTITGNFTLASGAFGGDGAVSMAGSSSAWSGGALTVGTGGLTNTGTLTLDTTNGNLVLTGAGVLTNKGAIKELGGNSLSIEPNAILKNSKTFDMRGDGGITGAGAFHNAGTFNKSNGTGTSTISSTLNNTGSMLVHKGTVNVSGTVIQVSGNTLTGGTWGIYGEGTGTTYETLTLGSADITTIGSKATVFFNGPRTVFTNLSGSVNNQGSFRLQAGKTFDTAGDFTNSGKLVVSGGNTLSVAGSFTQTSAGTLSTQIVVTPSKTTIGNITTGASGAVSLAGKLTLLVYGQLLPALNVSYTFLEDGNPSDSISSTFLNLPEGGTITVAGKTYRISYVGGDGNDVTITRIS